MAIPPTIHPLPHATQTMSPPIEGVSNQAVNRADCCKCPASASRLEVPNRALSLAESPFRSVLFCSTPRGQVRSVRLMPHHLQRENGNGKMGKRESGKASQIIRLRRGVPAKSIAFDCLRRTMCCAAQSRVSFGLMAARISASEKWIPPPASPVCRTAPFICCTWIILKW